MPFPQFLVFCQPGADTESISGRFSDNNDVGTDSFQGIEDNTGIEWQESTMNCSVGGEQNKFLIFKLCFTLL